MPLTGRDTLIRTRTKVLTTLREVHLLLRGRSWHVLALVIAAVAAAISESAVLALIAEAAGALLTQSHKVAIHAGPINVALPLGQLLIIGLALAVARTIFQLGLSYLPASIGAGVWANLDTNLFSVFTRSSWSVQSSDRDGEFQELMTTQAWYATQCVVLLTSLATAGIMFVIFVGSALLVEPLIALIALAAALGLLVLLRPLNSIGSKAGRGLSSTALDLGAGVNEAVTLAEEAHVFGVAPAQEERMAELISAVRRHFLVTDFLMGVAPGIYQCAVFLILVGALGVLYLSGARHVASLGAVVLLLLRASTYGQRMQGAFQGLAQQRPFLNRMREAERRYRDAGVVRGDHVFVGKPSISFDRVAYSYGGGIPALQDISFRVDPGESIGIIGPSGAGKSTLVQVLLGLREPDSGTYELDGRPSLSFSSTAWTRWFAYVPQEPRLLHGTVGDNIRFFRHLADDEVERAARLAGIHDEIMDWADGYKTVIGQRADAVSGGQRQRVCLARALAGDPLILVLDEPTSALDAHSESLIQESLGALKGRMTIFVVAHRLSTLKVCDKVMVLMGGRLDAFGPRLRLAESSRYYREALEVGLGLAGIGGSR